MENKPSVFISYAHKDGLEFTRRLAFALGMYMDVYWDIRLKTGPYPQQLLDEIVKRNFFLFVMTPHSLESEWCLRERKCAETNNNQGILLARVYNVEGTADPELMAKYTYGDFASEFEVGFQRITHMMLGYAVFSWEHLASASDSELLKHLDLGHIPGVIGKSLSEWAIVNRLWPEIDNYIREQKRYPIIVGNPRTPEGIRQMCSHLLPQFSNAIDSIGVEHTKEVRTIAERFTNELSTCKDDEHSKIGAIAYEIINSIGRVLMLNKSANLDAGGLASIQRFYHFDVAEKLRELLNTQARLSRYLY